MQRCLLIFLLALSLPAWGEPSQPADAWTPFNFLVGAWTAAGAGKPGESAGSFSFAFDLQGQILVRRSHVDYPATKDRPAFAHDDLTILHRDPAGGFRAVYFDNEGHVIHYAVAFSNEGRTLTFLSEPVASAPRFRLTYNQAGEDQLKIKFEIAPPSKPDQFATYVEGNARRK